MTLQLTGRLILIEPTKQVSDKFQTRDFVLDITEGEYQNFAKMQVTQKKCPILDTFKVGDTITAKFNVKGRKWEKDGKTSYFTTLEAWAINKEGSTPNEPTPPQPQQRTYAETLKDNPTKNEPIDDLPF